MREVLIGNFNQRLVCRQARSRPVRSKMPSASAASWARASSGSSILEILIAITVLSLGIGAVLLLSTANQDLKIDSLTNSEALSKAEGMLETARALSRQDFNSVSATAPANDDIYTKSIDVIDIDAFTKQVTSNVAWSASASRPVQISLTTRLTDQQGAIGGDTCNPILSGDWTKPQDWKDGYGYADIVSPNGASGLDAFNKKIYLTSDIGNKNDFYIIDVSNPKPAGLNLPILGSLKTTYGLTDVRVAGKYAYVAADSAQYQLLVIDISDPLNLNPSKIVKKLDLTAPGDTAYGNTLYYSKRKIYLGLTKSSGAEFHIIDVSDPLNPIDEGSFETNTAVNQIIVKDGLAYLATPSSSQVWILDVSDPTNPHQTDPIKQTFSNPPGWSNWSGQSLALSGNTLYFGRIYNIGANSTDLFILDSTDLTEPPAGTLVQTKQDGVSRMVIRNNLLFMSNSAPNDGFQIWDVSNPASLNRYDTAPINIQQTSTAGMDCDGNLIYIGQTHNRALQIIGPGP